jgi:arylsulfatase A-like enzyme
MTLLVAATAGCTADPEHTSHQSSAPAGTVRPHLVLVIIDTLRADHLPTYGYARATAPHIQALGERGWVFEQALAQSGWTLPAMGSILSGRLPSEHGAVRDGNDMRRFGRFAPQTPSTAEVLAAAGYRTGAVVNNTFLAPDFGFQRGFDHYDYQGASAMQHRAAVATADAGLAWLDTAATPAFLVLHFMEPHSSYAAGPPERGRFAPTDEELRVPFPFHMEHGKFATSAADAAALEQIAALYDEEILAADRGVGRLVEGLSERGMLDDTWIIVTSDHGEELWDHGGFEHGHHLMGELLRVPLIVAGPTTTPRRVLRPVAHVDVHATLVGLGGDATADRGHGLDLTWALQAPDRLPAERAMVAEDCLYGPWRSAVTRGRYRLETNHMTNQSRLFEIDRYGQNDRAADEKVEIANALSQEMHRLRGGRGAPRLADTTRVLDLDAAKLEQLRALGYLQ